MSSSIRGDSVLDFEEAIKKLHPWRSFSAIERRYGVILKDDDLIKLKELIIKNELEEAVKFLHNIGDKHNLKGTKLKAFIHEVMMRAYYELDIMRVFRLLEERQKEEDRRKRNQGTEAR